MDVVTLYNLLQKDLDLVTENMQTILHHDSSDFAAEIITYILSSQGKLIRPILVFLCAYVIEAEFDEHQYSRLIDVATAVEIIHIASLIHDDVIDEASVRRNNPSVNAKYTDQVSVTMGVFFYSVSLQLVARTGLISVLLQLSTSVRAMCEGELLQQQVRTSGMVTRDQYFEIIQAKTAALFKAACLSGACVAGVNGKRFSALEQYAQHLGVAFQLTDDYLDLFSDGRELKKDIGQDFYQGQLTLPLIVAYETLSQSDQEEVESCMKSKDPKGLELLRKAISTHGIQNELLTQIDDEINAAKMALDVLPDNQFKEALGWLSEYVKARMD